MTIGVVEMTIGMVEIADNDLLNSPANRRGEFYTDEGCFVLELSNRPDDPALSIARVRVLPGAITRWHRLQGTAERYVILEGKGLAEVGGMDPQEVSAGDVVLIPPWCPQRIANIGQGDLIFLALCTPRFTQEIYEDIDINPGLEPGKGEFSL